MKKLMIAAAVLSVAVCAMAVESANVVGYQTIAVSGYKMITPTFKNITDAAYPIDNFTVQGATDGMATIQILDTAGQTSGLYYWYNAYGEYPAGWFDFAGVEPAGISLAPGEAVFFNTTESGVTVQSAGQVPGEITHDVEGYMMLGNGSPTTIDIDDLTVTGATDGMTTIQVLDENGQTSGLYYWYNAFGEYPAGWFDFAGVEPAGISLAPGEAVFFNTSEVGVKMTVPSAL